MRILSFIFSARYAKILTIAVSVVLGFPSEIFAQYCNPAYIASCLTNIPEPVADFIDDFSTTGAVVNISNLNTGCNGSFPENYTYHSGMNLTIAQGCNFTASMQSGQSFAQGFGIWIDWNQDLDFNDAGEYCYNSGAFGTNVFTGIVNVPPASLLGSTRMRVRCAFATVPTAPCGTEPSGTFKVGEVEDYPVTVVANTANLVANGVTICAGQSASLNAVGGGLVKWYTQQTGGALIGVGNFYNTPILNVTTTYYVQTTLGSCTTPRIAVVVTVAPAFTLSLTAAPTQACAGAPIALTTTTNSATALTYVWTPATNITANAGASATGNISANTTFTVVASNAANCSVTATAAVTLLPTALLNLIASATNVCPGGSSTLTVSGGSGYTWSPSTSLSATTGISVVATPTLPTTYTVVSAPTSAACPASATINIGLHPTPSVNAGTDVSYCAGLSGNLSASGATSYVWAPTSSLSNANAANPVVSSATTQTYTVTGTSALGCTATDQVLVTVNSLPSANAGSGGANCSGTGLQLNGSGGNTYSWSPATGLSNASIANPIATPSVTTNYTLIVNNGCNSLPSAPVTVTVFQQPPAATIAANGPTTFCQGNSVVLSSSASANYLWSNGATTQSITVNASGNYSVTVTDANGCTAAASSPFLVTVTAPPAAPVLNASGALSFCSGGNVTLISSQVSGNTWSTGATSNQLIVSASGAYTATYTDGNGCVSNPSVPISVTAWALPIANAGNSGSNCSGSGVQLTGSGGVNYNWTPAAGLSNASISNPFANPINTTNYNLTVTDANGCISNNTATAAITVFPNPIAPAITANGPFNFCQGNNVILSAASNASYLWSTGATTQAITVNQSGNFSVIITDNNGCVSPVSAIATVIVFPTPAAPILTVNGPTSFCDGNTLQIQANLTTGINWSNGLTGQQIDAGASGPYTATFTSADGCVSQSSNTIFIQVQPSGVSAVISASGPTQFCEGDSVTLTSSAADSYSWSTGQTTPSIKVYLSGNYSVSITSGCPALNPTASILIQVNPIPIPTITASSVVDCLPSIIDFSSTTLGTPPFAFKWTFGDGSTATSSQPSHQYKNEGTYDVTLTLTDQIGCKGSISLKDFITILPPAEIAYSIVPKFTTLSNATVYLIGQTPDIQSEIWDLEGIGTSIEDTAIFTFTQIGIYPLTYSAVTLEGCSDSRRDTIYVYENLAVFVPTCFSPNEDGINEIFIPVTTGFDPTNYNFSLFNRWGQMIFESDKPGEGWDGLNGTQDVYIWKLSGRSFMGTDHSYSGYTTLIR